MRSIVPGCASFLLAITLCIPNADAKVNFIHKLPDLAVNLPANAGPQAIALADVTNDRRADIIAVDTNRNQVVVFVNDGTGGFGAGEPFNTGAGPVAVAVADLNHDALLDIITVNQGDSSVSILLGQSGGGFGAAKNFAVGSGPVGVAVARLDSDQNDDLAVLSADSVYLLKGDGSGGFTPFSPSSVLTGGSGAVAIATGQFRNNGFVDLAVTDPDSGDVFVILGNGDGTFGTSTSVYNQGNFPEGIRVGDFNNDGNQDIAFVSRGDLSGTGDTDVHLWLLDGNGDGTFQDPVETDQPDNDSMWLAATDLDNDGRIDLVVVALDASTSVFCNQPSVICFDSGPHAPGDVGGFQLQSPIGSLAAGAVAVQATSPCGSPPQVGCGDINGDGLPDLADLSTDGASIRVLINASVAVATPTITPTVSGSVSPTATGNPTPTPTMPPGTPTSTPPPAMTPTPTPIPIPYTECPFQVGGRPVAVAIGTFINGASPAIAVADSQQGNILLVPSHVDSKQTDACGVLGLATPTVVAPVRSPVALLADDFDRDGNLDLAVAGADGVTVLFGDGKGGFPSASIQVLHTPQSASSIAAADFNRDGIPDIIAADGTGTVSLFFGAGGRNFQPPCPISAGSSAAFIVANDPNGNDLNSDGWPDFAVGSSQVSFLSVFLRRTPTPTPTGAPTQSPAPACLTTSDFQGLSPLDLTAKPMAIVVDQLEPPGNNNLPDFAAAQANGDVLVYFGRQTPAPVTYYVGPELSVPPPNPVGPPSLSAIGSGDVNGDRLADLVVTDQENGDVVTFLAQPDGSFVAVAPISVGLKPMGLAVGDIDGDRKADVVTANAGDGSISVLVSSRPPPTPLPPTPTETGTPTMTGTALPTQTPTGTPSSTVTATGTRTFAPTVTPTAAPTSTAHGVITLNGSCALDPVHARPDWNIPILWAVAGGLLARRRRLLRRPRGDRCARCKA